MRAPRQLGLAVTGLALALPLLAFGGSDPLEGRIVVVQSKDAAGSLDRRRVIAILKDACSDLHIDESAVPRIVFIHLSASEALVGNVPAGAGMMIEHSTVVVENNGEPGPPRFVVWIVDRQLDRALVHAVVNVLDRHLQLDLSRAELAGTEQRVARRLSATVPVSSLLAK